MTDAICAVAALIMALATAPPLAVADKDDLGTRKNVYKFVSCVVSRNPKIARDFVKQDVPDEVIAKKYPGFVSPDCLKSGQLKLPGDALRYNIAEVLFKTDYATSPLDNFATVAVLTHRFSDDGELNAIGVSKDTRSLKREMSRLSRVGECVVRKNATASIALVTAELGDEGAALSEVRALVEQCSSSPPAETLSASVVRGTVALNLYRLSASAFSHIDGDR